MHRNNSSIIDFVFKLYKRRNFLVINKSEDNNMERREQLRTRRDGSVVQ